MTSPQGNLSSESPVGFPGKNPCTHVTVCFAGEGRSTVCLCPLTRGKMVGSLCLDFQVLLVSLPLSDPVMYPLVIINLSCEHKYILRSESSSNGS